MTTPSSDSVAFYTRLKNIQALQHKREQKRMELQRRFDSYVTSDQRLSRLRAAKLQSYWKKICEDEKKSKARNEQLLRDFNRVEAHIATLSSRTERLRLLKDQYEKQVEAMYPYWKEQFEIKRQSQVTSKQHLGGAALPTAYQQHFRQDTLNFHSTPGPVLDGVSKTFSSTPLHQPQATPYTHVHSVQEAASHANPPQAVAAPHQWSGPSHAGPLHPTQVLPQQQHIEAPVTLPQSGHSHPMQIMTDGNTLPHVMSQYPAAVQREHVRHPEQMGGTAAQHDEKLPSKIEPGRHPQELNGRTEDTGSLPTSSEFSPSSLNQPGDGGPPQGIAPGVPANKPENPQDIDANLDVVTPQAMSRTQGGQPQSDGSHGGRPGVAYETKETLQAHKAAPQAPRIPSVAATPPKLSSAQTEPFSSDDEVSDVESGERLDQALYSPELPPALPKYEEAQQQDPVHQVLQAQNSEGSLLGQGDVSESSGSEEDSEIDSDVSLPLSDTDVRHTAPIPAERKQVPTGQADSKESNHNSIALSATGFWLLLKAVEAEVDETDSLEGIYASLPCTQTIRDEIVRTANAKTGFDRLDPRAISMVVLEELPLLVRQLPGGCLLSERLLVASSRTITEVSIRSHMYSSSLKFWDDIFHHMVFLVRRGVMEPEVVAKKFAPLLVAANSLAVEKAVNVMSDILLKAEEEEITLGDESSVTETSPTTPDNPIPSPEVTPTQLDKPADYPSVPPLSLGKTDGDTDDHVDTGRTSADSFFDNKVPLTETSAYQKMMMMTTQQERSREGKEFVSAGSSNEMSEEEEEEEDSEDEIERAARLDLESPASQQSKRKRNVLSSLGGSFGRSLDSPVGDDDGLKGDPIPSDRSDDVSSPDKSDLPSSLSPTPRDGGGYMPSAMEKSMKSTGRTDTMNRSAAFWGNESDLDDESEMSVPMGTGVVAEDKDDFDFYD
ncbi:uncharacterized protein [Diadema antillarum]|uniref:uncharacterized protein n=1 Tax=Diadema antillarum TaxID=105358 RepID=UPI003A85EB28